MSSYTFYKKTQLKFHEYSILFYIQEGTFYKKLNEIFNNYLFPQGSEFHTIKRKSYYIFIYELLNYKYIKVTFNPIGDLQDKQNGQQISSNIVIHTYISKKFKTNNYRICFTLNENECEVKQMKEIDIATNEKLNKIIENALLYASG